MGCYHSGIAWRLQTAPQIRTHGHARLRQSVPKTMRAFLKRQIIDSWSAVIPAEMTSYASALFLYRSIAVCQWGN
jgi:hypothetical protein